MFDAVLVANRGEIACRVFRTARRLGHRTVAVHTDADADALHVRSADMAVRIGSYLDIAAVVDAARRAGADAVHPGYGFLSENAAFAAACANAGLVFIGPPVDAIRTMGDKARAKRRMAEAGVACVPGWQGDEQGDARLAAESARLGLPLLVKAVAGGGGRGMRLVRSAGELAPALTGARREAEAAFGDGRLMLERLVDDGRHIEVQLFADAHGNAVHLGERDCTAQRRRQKVVEETPSPTVDGALREALCRDALAAARAVGYVGAGTVEFIVDPDGRHFFLEMNTRLQVEHPVTEAVTGIDLVEWQLRIAAGEPLPLAQADIRFDGHAVEARLYAEDPADGWAPQTGRVARWQPDAAGIRIDHGIADGSAVTPHYDALLAKLVAHGRDRADAVRRLVRALDDTPLFGVRTNAGFLRALLLHPDFALARLTTTRLDEWQAAGAAPLQRPEPPPDLWRVAAAVLAPPAWRKPGTAGFDLTLVCGVSTRTLRAPPAGIAVLGDAGGRLQVDVDGVRRALAWHRDGATVALVHEASVFVFTEPSPGRAAADAPSPARAVAPVAGTVAQLLVALGDRVDAGQRLASIEAMKMEMWVVAGAAGRVAAVHVKPRDGVAGGALVVELEPDPS